MRTVIFLSNREVKALTGTGGKIPQISKICLDYAPEGSIINGQVIENEAFTDFLRDFWSKNQLPQQDVVLVLGNSQSITRMIQVPEMSRNKLMQYLSRELPPAADWSAPIYSYWVLGQKGKMQIMSVSVMNHTFAESHISRFKKLGILLSSVVTSPMAGAVVMEQLNCIQEESAIIQVLDGINLINLLYVDGKYYQHNMSRVFSSRGTGAFGIEAARNVSHLQQFLKSELPDKTVNRVFLGGEFQKADLEVCRDCIQQMDKNLDVKPIYCEPGKDVNFPNASELPFERIFTLVGGLLIPGGKGNLLYEYRRSPEKEKAQREMIHSLLPVLSLLGIFAIATLCMCVAWMLNLNKVSEQLTLMDNAAAREASIQYEQLAMEKENIALQMEIIDKTMNHLMSYPPYELKIKNAVKQAASPETWANVNEYSMETGSVFVEAYSADMSGIQKLAEQLEARIDLFSHIDYTGFEQDREDGYWKGTIQCHLLLKDGNNWEVAP